MQPGGERALGGPNSSLPVPRESYQGDMYLVKCEEQETVIRNLNKGTF